MAAAAMYIYKERDLLGYGRPSIGRPKGSMRYSKWRRVCPYATLGEAADQMVRDLRDGNSLLDRGVFHKGKRILPERAKS
jgi:hypothetical protein